jgi:hypothetical protein
MWWYGVGSLEDYLQNKKRQGQCIVTVKKTKQESSHIAFLARALGNLIQAAQYIFAIPSSQRWFVVQY